MSKGFSKIEKFVCELCWGSVPVDTEWARQTGLFKQKLKEFEAGNFKELWQQENKNTRIAQG